MCGFKKTRFIEAVRKVNHHLIWTGVVHPGQSLGHHTSGCRKTMMPSVSWCNTKF